MCKILTAVSGSAKKVGSSYRLDLVGKMGGLSVVVATGLAAFRGSAVRIIGLEWRLGPRFFNCWLEFSLYSVERFRTMLLASRSSQIERSFCTGGVRLAWTLTSPSYLCASSVESVMLFIVNTLNHCAGLCGEPGVPLLPDAVKSYDAHERVVSRDGQLLMVIWRMTLLNVCRSLVETPAFSCTVP